MGLLSQEEVNVIQQAVNAAEQIKTQEAQQAASEYNNNAGT